MISAAATGAAGNLAATMRARAGCAWPAPRQCAARPDSAGSPHGHAWWTGRRSRTGPRWWTDTRPTGRPRTASTLVGGVRSRRMASVDALEHTAPRRAAPRPRPRPPRCSRPVGPLGRLGPGNRDTRACHEPKDEEKMHRFKPGAIRPRGGPGFVGILNYVNDINTFVYQSHIQIIDGSVRCAALHAAAFRWRSLQRRKRGSGGWAMEEARSAARNGSGRVMPEAGTSSVPATAQPSA